MRFLLVFLLALTGFLTVPAFGQFGAASRILSGTGAPVSAQCTVENNVGLVWARKDGADAGTTFYVCGATGVGTYGWELRGGAPGGGSSLTTVGAVPFVTASGVLGQDGGLNWVVAANVKTLTLTDGSSQGEAGNFFVNWNGGQPKFRIGRTLNALPSMQFFTAAGAESFYILNAGPWRIWDSGSNGLAFGTNNTERARFAATTGNLLLGTTTDANFRLNVGSSGSAGTAQFYDATATIGNTVVVVRNGPGQTSDPFRVLDAFGVSVLAKFDSGGNIFGNQLLDNTNAGRISSFGITVASNRLFGFSSTTTSGGSPDLSLSRASAGVLQVGDGGANSNGDLAYREWRGTARTFANLGTPADGTFVYCSNCTVANPCASGGTGAFARRLNAAWVCSDGGGGGGSGTVTSVSVSTGLLSVANPTTTPDISIAGTSGGVPYFSNGTTLASSAALDAGALVVGGGAGGAPTVLANSSVPNAGELRISTTPTPGATRSVFTLGGAITGGNNSANGGTFYALNAPSGFIGDFMRFELNGASAFAVNRLGTITIGTANTFGSSGVSVSNVGTLAYANTSSGASAASRITGSAGTGSSNFLALRPTSASSGPDVLRVNADQRGVMIGQTAETASVSNLSLGVFDDTASTGVTRAVVQMAANQGSTSPFEVRGFNATLGDGALLYEIEPDGSFRSLPTGTRPTCASGIRGTYWYTQGGTGVKDAVEVCTKDAADVYAWRVIF